MIPPSQAISRPTPGSSSEPERKGSVKRARQLLEAGVRPTGIPVSRTPSAPARDAAYQTPWPLPASGLQPRPLNPHNPRFMDSRGPPPLRPPRPSDVPSQIPSPSIYSVRSGENSDPNLPLNSSNPYPYPTRPGRSFSHPNQRHHQLRQTANNETLSSTSIVDMNSYSPVGTDDSFRHSIHSTSSSIPYTSSIVPLPERVMPQSQSPRQASGLNIPNTRRSRVQSSVSPIPEEIPDPRQAFRSYASSRVIPSSWGSGPAESEILGAYLDEGSSDEGDERPRHEHEEVNPVRSASVGKRHRPTMRTIMKSNPSSEVSIPDMPNAPLSYASAESIHDPIGPTTTTVVGEMTRTPAAGHITMRTPSPVRRGSISSFSGESYVDPEKPRFAKQEEQGTFRGALEKELETLPQAAPTMSDKRPNGRKPPRLNLDAVRGAEARGSLSSLTDLIRRATKLASNLDRGRTASRADLAGEGFRFNDSGYRGRTSGSLSDILASFPNPSVITPDTRSSWPVFFGGGGRSNLRNIEPLPSHDDLPEEVSSQRRCCGMPRKWFILLCILIFIVVVLAVLLPVFLVAVPRENAENHSCSHTTPCYHGGVSVSSGTECSCVCTDGYTGSQCTEVGDSSCVIAEVDSGGVHENATMGSSIPSLLDQSESKFSIDLDPVTILALFSLRNISCESEDALVAFSKVDASGSSGNTRRSLLSPVDTDVSVTFQGKANIDALKQPATSTRLDLVSRVMEARSLASTTNGIYYDQADSSSDDAASTKDDSERATSATSSTTSMTTTAEVTATATNTGASSTSTSSTANIPSGVLEFSRVAVLYILEKTGSIDSAKESETQIQTYLLDSYPSASHPAVEVLGWYSLDFENKTITTG
ncbi:hypothetical protein N7528_007187 [Penicillium herquei]|nr:hypothetical protein N7528_007187 [Penicillium herquei]